MDILACGEFFIDFERYREFDIALHALDTWIDMKDLVDDKSLISLLDLFDYFYLLVLNQKAKVDRNEWNLVDQMLCFVLLLNLQDEIMEWLDVRLHVSLIVVDIVLGLLSYILIHRLTLDFNRNLKGQKQVWDGAHQLILLLH